MVNHLERPAFLDETSIRTNMARTTGRAPRGERLVDHAPFRRWRPRTFIDALRHDRLGTPWGIDGAMSAEMSGLYVGTQLLPTLRAGDVFGPLTRTNGVRGLTLDNLSSHKSRGAAAALRRIGAWFPFLPPYSPDLNPMEMAFSKLKSLIRKAAARTYDQLWAALGRVCNLFSDEECFNCFKAAGYEADRKRHAPAAVIRVARIQGESVRPVGDR
ncbi:MAG: transposase [Rhodobacteraceae bacterium]|nr:transposase [Paracoccaceae bacterium]